MIATTLPEKLYTVEEYLAFEKKAQSKYEFYNGKIVPMPGGSAIHNQIVSRLISKLINVIDEIKKEYIVYNSDMNTSIYLKSIECELPLTKIYKGVKFETPSSPAESKQS